MAEPLPRHPEIGVPSRSILRLTLALAVAAPFLAGCDLSSRVVAVQLSAGVADTTFSLRVGQEARLEIMGLRFTFLRVTNDSRCPSDVMCVWAGDAGVQVRVSYGNFPPVVDTLHTTLDPRSVTVAGYQFTLLALQPYPVSTSTIPADRYVATFRLQRLYYAPD